MNENENRITVRRVVSVLLAVCLVVAVGVFAAKDRALKADEYGDEGEVVREMPDYFEEPIFEEPVFEEPVFEEPVFDEPMFEEPAFEETEYDVMAYEEPELEEMTFEEPELEAVTFEEPDFETPETETVEFFDVVKAYEHYLTLETDEERELYLESLSFDDREMLLDYIDIMNEMLSEAPEFEEIEEEPMLAMSVPEFEEIETVEIPEYETETVEIPEPEETEAVEIPESEETEEAEEEHAAEEAEVPEEEEEAEPEEEEDSELLMYYDMYSFMTDEERETFLENLPEEDRAALEKLINGDEADEEEPAEEEVPAEEADEEEPEEAEEENEEPAEAEEVPEEDETDSELIKMYEAYTKMSDEEKAAYLDSLSEEDRATFEALIAEKEAAEETEEEEPEETEEETEEKKELIVNVTMDNLTEGVLRLGSEIRLNAVVENADEGAEYTYQWQESDNGEDWTDIEGEINAEYYLTVSKDNYMKQWRVIVNG